MTKDSSMASTPLLLASILARLNLQETLPLPDLFLQQGFPCEKTRARLIAKMIKYINLFNVFPLPVLICDYNLQLLLVLITELFVPKFGFIDLKMKTKPIRNFKITVTIRIDYTFIKPIVCIYMKGNTL